MPNGGKLTVFIKDVLIDEAEAQERAPMSPGDYVLFAVTDTGHGVNIQIKALVFEPFFTAKDLGKGYGSR